MRRRRWGIQATVVLLAAALLLPPVRSASCRCADGCLSRTCCGRCEPSGEGRGCGPGRDSVAARKLERRAISCCGTDDSATVATASVAPAGSCDDLADSDRYVTVPAECCDCGGPVAGPSVPFIVPREPSLSAAASQRAIADAALRPQAGHYGHRRAARPPPLSAQSRCGLLCRWLK